MHWSVYYAIVKRLTQHYIVYAIVKRLIQRLIVFFAIVTRLIQHLIVLQLSDVWFNIGLFMFNWFNNCLTFDSTKMVSE